MDIEDSPQHRAWSRLLSIMPFTSVGIILVVSLLMMGLVSNSAFADGPPTTNELLNDADIVLLDELPSDIANILANEFLPALEAHGFDV